MSNWAAVIVAAGTGQRAGLPYNKSFYSPFGRCTECSDEVTVRTCILGAVLENLAPVPCISQIIIVCGAEDRDSAQHIAETMCPNIRHTVTAGGDCRTESVRAGLQLVRNDIEYIMIHDGARPYVTADRIQSYIMSAERFGTAIPVCPSRDALFDIRSGTTLNTADYAAVLTPQCFRAADIRRAYAVLPVDCTMRDDVSVYRACPNCYVHTVEDTARNTKVTYPMDIEDYTRYILSRGVGLDISRIRGGVARSGIGYDLHPLARGRRLVLGGVEIPHEFGAVGHSDADVVLHAVMDALLSACGLPDIGHLFPDTDAAYLGIDSRILSAAVCERVAECGMKPYSIAVDIICQEPKISPYESAIRNSLAQVFGVERERIGIAATTTEHLGVTAGRAVACLASVTLVDIKK